MRTQDTAPSAGRAGALQSRPRGSLFLAGVWGTQYAKEQRRRDGESPLFFLNPNLTIRGPLPVRRTMTPPPEALALATLASGCPRPAMREMGRKPHSPTGAPHLLPAPQQRPAAHRTTAASSLEDSATREVYLLGTRHRLCGAPRASRVFSPLILTTDETPAQRRHESSARPASSRDR